jgi:hypothetical protein
MIACVILLCLFDVINIETAFILLLLCIIFS